jgi:DNA repair protein RadC
MTTEQNEQQESNLPGELAAPARRALAGAGLRRLEQLTQVTEAELKQLHGIGPNAIRQLRQALDANGLSFADEKQRSE